MRQEDNYLVHYRTKGSKNGERLYQYEDGTYTPLGKARRRVGEAGERAKKAANNWAEKNLTRNIKNGKDKPSVSPAEKRLKYTSEMIDQAANLTNTISSIKERKTLQNDYSSITDDELRKTINRLQLERQYVSLTKEDTSRGMSIVKDILSVAGPVVGIASGIVGIVATTYNMKNKKD